MLVRIFLNFFTDFDYFESFFDSLVDTCAFPQCDALCSREQWWRSCSFQSASLFGGIFFQSARTQFAHFDAVFLLILPDNVNETQ